jgi:hypothetical protein
VGRAADAGRLSALFWIYLALGCIRSASSPSSSGWFPQFDPNGRILHMYTCFWGQLFFWSNPFWRLRVEGRKHIPWDRAAVLVSNHQSLGDILVLFGLWRPFKWVSKASNFDIPFIGWKMRLNRYVQLVRGDKESIAACRRTCGYGSGVRPGAALPQGTRPDGQVKAFKDGAFRPRSPSGCRSSPAPPDASFPSMAGCCAGWRTASASCPRSTRRRRGRRRARTRARADLTPAQARRAEGLVVQRLLGVADARRFFKPLLSDSALHPPSRPGPRK